MVTELTQKNPPVRRVAHRVTSDEGRKLVVAQSGQAGDEIRRGGGIGGEGELSGGEFTKHGADGEVVGEESGGGDRVGSRDFESPREERVVD